MVTGWLDHCQRRMGWVDPPHQKGHPRAGNPRGGWMGRDMEKGDPESPPNAWMKNGWEMEQEKARAKRESIGWGTKNQRLARTGGPHDKMDGWKRERN